MPKSKSGTKTMIERLLKAIDSAGIVTNQIDVSPDGTVKIKTAPKDREAVNDENEWDEILP